MSLQDVQYKLSMTHGKLAQFKMSLLMLSRCVDGHEDLRERVKILTMSYSCIEDLAEERHSAYMLRFVKSEEPIVGNERPVPITVDVNHTRTVAQIKTASEQNDIFTIVALMKSHVSASAVQQEACQLLACLALIDVNQVSIATTGGIAAIVSCMEAHRDHAGVQEMGCMALANLAVNAGNKVLIAKTGGITAIVKGMNAHYSQSDVLKFGCGALASLAITHDDNRLAIAKAGGIIAIVSGMKAHQSQSDVQTFGCGALASLAATHDENRLAIVKVGGIAAIMSGMESHADHGVVQEMGCLELCNLSTNPKVASLIEGGGGVQVLEAASSYPYAGRALDKTQKASIPKKKATNDSARNRDAPIQESDEEPANGRNRSVRRIWKSIKCLVKIYDLCEEYQEIEEEEE